jgi:hypothetical protein
VFVPEARNCDIFPRAGTFCVLTREHWGVLLCILHLKTMFRTAVRRFAATSWRFAGSVPELTVPQIEEAYQWGIQISKAQAIAKRGLVDGTVIFTLGWDLD